MLTSEEVEEVERAAFRAAEAGPLTATPAVYEAARLAAIAGAEALAALWDAGDDEDPRNRCECATCTTGVTPWDPSRTLTSRANGDAGSGTKHDREAGA